MNEDLPQPFGQLTPRPAPQELRSRVLDAVARELAQRARARWQRVCEVAVAASLVLGIGLNVWQQRAEDAWQMRVYGPPPVTRAIADVAQTVAAVTDAQTGQWVERRLTESLATRHHADSQFSERYERILRDFTNLRTDGTL